MKRKYTIYGMIMVVVLAFSSCQLGKHYARPELNSVYPTDKIGRAHV